MKKASRWVWVLCALIILTILVNMVVTLKGHPAYSDFFAWTSAVAVFVIPIVFAFQGALILSRQPNNAIGWLLMIPALAVALPLNGYILTFQTPPAHPTFLFYFVLWVYGWSWVPLIFPILFLPMLFPTGRPLSPRWRWQIILGVGMVTFFMLLGIFTPTFEMTDLGWSIPNPIGFIPADAWDKYINVPWFICLITLTISSVVSLILRYRRAAGVERAQIKWLLYVCVIFAVIYISGIPIVDTNAINAWFTFFSLVVLAVPIVITMAILRYRLWDIDLIIRRTLQYAVLTLMLALVYFGLVLTLEGAFRVVSGQDSPLAVVLSTLVIAALFSPLRKRIQNFIDRRFFRARFNAEQATAAFSATARRQVALDMLADQLKATTQEALQPEGVWVWIREPGGPGSKRIPE